MKPANTRRQLCEVYGEHAISDSVVRRWVRHFNERRENVHDDPQSGRPSLVNEDLVRALVGEDSREQTIHHFVTLPAFSTNSMTTRSKKKRGLHRRLQRFMMQDTKKLLPRHDKCLESGGN
jgi:transposase